MQYQVFVQPHPEQCFVASIIGMPQVSVAGVTEAEAISNVKAALESQLATGRVVTINVGGVDGIEMGVLSDGNPFLTQQGLAKICGVSDQMSYAGLFSDDPTFDDWMEKLAVIRQNANQIDDVT